MQNIACVDVVWYTSIYRVCGGSFNTYGRLSKQLVYGVALVECFLMSLESFSSFMIQHDLYDLRRMNIISGLKMHFVSNSANAAKAIVSLNIIRNVSVATNFLWSMAHVECKQGEFVNGVRLINDPGKRNPMFIKKLTFEHLRRLLIHVPEFLGKRVHKA
jgi:hypothetical protein